MAVNFTSVASKNPGWKVNPEMFAICNEHVHQLCHLLPKQYRIATSIKHLHSYWTI